MKRKFNNGDFVQARRNPDWGLGKVIESFKIGKRRITRYTTWFENDVTMNMKASELIFISPKDL